MKFKSRISRVNLDILHKRQEYPMLWWGHKLHRKIHFDRSAISHELSEMKNDIENNLVLRPKIAIFYLDYRKISYFMLEMHNFLTDKWTFTL